MTGKQWRAKFAGGREETAPVVRRQPSRAGLVANAGEVLMARCGLSKRYGAIGFQYLVSHSIRAQGSQFIVTRATWDEAQQYRA